SGDPRSGVAPPTPATSPSNAREAVTTRRASRPSSSTLIVYSRYPPRERTHCLSSAKLPSTCDAHRPIDSAFFDARVMVFLTPEVSCQTGALGRPPKFSTLPRTNSRPQISLVFLKKNHVGARMRLRKNGAA